MPLPLRTLLLLAATAATAHAATAPLKSPWDLHPVTAVGTDKPYTCPQAAPLPKDIVAFDYYSDAKHSVVDEKRYAAYQATQDTFRATTRAAQDAADNFQSTGNKAAAECALRILSANAANASMTGSMASNQSNYVQNWTLGALAVAWLKVRPASPGTEPDRKAVTAWLVAVARQTNDYFTARNAKHTNDGTNNHLYWAGFAVMAAGIAANDRALYDWGESTFAEGATRIAPDGSLPLEMARGQRALHYHLFAIAPLVMMAEFAAANGENLYTAKDSALRRLVTRTVSGLTDNAWFTEHAGARQDTPEEPGKYKSDDLLILKTYNRRFPDPALTKLLASVDFRPFGYIGGMPPP